MKNQIRFCCLLGLCFVTGLMPEVLFAQLTGRTNDLTAEVAAMPPKQHENNLEHKNPGFNQLTVGLTADAEFTRNYQWDISMECQDNHLILAPGQAFRCPFTWTTSVTYKDSDFQVSGTITIVNRTPQAAVITGVSYVLSTGVNVDAVSGMDFPFQLESGKNLSIPYRTVVPDMRNGTNTVTVSTSTTQAEGISATVDYLFRLPTKKMDDCVTLTGDCYLPVTFCDEVAPVVTNYKCLVGPFDSTGMFTFVNTINLQTNTTGAQVVASSKVTINVPRSGCTLTQGYWKTHSEFGPEAYDNTWAQLPKGAGTPFFKSGKSWYDVYNTPKDGNAYINLACQYMTAKLNLLNGATSTPNVDVAMGWAEAFFASSTPARWLDRDAKTCFLYAGRLEAYNNGFTGCGHCSEVFENQMANDQCVQNHSNDPTAPLCLSPNRAGNMVSVDLTAYHASEDLNIAIYDAHGGLKMQQHLGGHGGETLTLRLNQSDFPAGQYVVVLYHANGMSQAVLNVTNQ